MLVLARIALLATAIALAAALSACGGQDNAAKNDYVRHVNAAQTRFAGAVTKVKRDITETSSARQDRRSLIAFGSTIDDLVATLRAIKAPPDVRNEHRRLVSAMAGNREELAAIIARMRSSGAAAFADVNRRLVAATVTVNARLRSATAAINAKLRG